MSTEAERRPSDEADRKQLGAFAREAAERTYHGRARVEPGDDEINRDQYAEAVDVECESVEIETGNE